MASLKVVLFQLLGREFLPPFFILPPVATHFSTSVNLSSDPLQKKNDTPCTIL